MNRLSKTYLAALEKHLKQGASGSLQPAYALGRRAVVLGLETLDLARIHEGAVTTLELSNSKNGLLKRAEIFFNEANSLIEETHRATRQSTAHLSRLKETLDQRTVELATSNRQLKRGVALRKVAKTALEHRKSRHQTSLKESLQLQSRLRQLTHRVLVAQEDERQNISRELQDEIAQTLLGINVRLLSLKQAARHKTSKGFRNEITSTQRLVAKSAQSVRRVARKIRNA